MYAPRGRRDTILTQISDHPALIVVTHGIVARVSAWVICWAGAIPRALPADTAKTGYGTRQSRLMKRLDKEADKVTASAKAKL
jgi:hypothetical protein